MDTDAFDTIVVGAGPAGSTAAMDLARHGARVALVDKAGFPRDKACGDLVGPRGVALLEQRGLRPPGLVALGDMEVIGPTGGRVLLPAVAGRTYPGCAWSLPRQELDHLLHRAALDAGAVGVRGRAGAVATGSGGAEVTLDTGRVLRAGTVVGADGATSAVARLAGLVDDTRVRWGFAVRTYIRADPGLPAILLFDDPPGSGFPGYGWIFPGPGGMANVGVGVGVGADRRAGSRATRALGEFLEHLKALSLLPPGARATSTLGGWLKMGMVGTRPAAGPVLLAGDAAGLVNPLQGEGISQAVESAAAAARAIVEHGDGAAAAYRGWLGEHQAAYQGSAVMLQSLLLGRARTASRVARLLTWPPVGRRLAPGWALYWNDLVAGAAPGPGVATARAAGVVVRGATAASAARRALRRDLA